MVTWIILAEIAFWIAIIAGLIARYILKKERLSIIFFLLTPIIDFALFMLTAIDLKNGQAATAVHGIAAIYIGVSVAYGKTFIDWADEKFRIWIVKQPNTKERLVGRAKGVHEVKLWMRHIVAYAVGGVLLWAMIQYIGQAGDTTTLQQMLKVWGLVVLIDGAISISYVVLPERK
ncbi:hypothetical protein AAGS61_09085 [Lysinibacillus sp. KU-BSD001]|uniref:hypothetical protein n=1 Tax=Lysinibacillus sp. KU-BSD001 TaxID=3141328 RepID=UPI0036E285E8